MKQLKDIILEKLHINRNTKPIDIEINIKGETRFTDEELDKIKNYTKELLYKPIEITNIFYGKDGKILPNKDAIFIYFKKESEKNIFISIVNFYVWNYYQLSFMLNDEYYKQTNGEYLYVKDKQFDNVLDLAKNLPKNELDRYFDKI